MEQVNRASALMTDDAGQYRIIGPVFARYKTVNHGIEEYVRGDVHTNTIEGYFSIMKRGINGVYHHVSPQHLNDISLSSISGTTSAPRSKSPTLNALRRLSKAS